MLPPVKGFGVWILPDRDSQRVYHDLILTYADLFQSEPFLPHITLCRVPELPIPELKGRLAKVAAQCPPFQLDTAGITCRDEPYQKIILECTANRPFYLLAEEIDRVFGDSAGKKTDLHLSLLYSRAGCPEVAAVLKELNGLKSLKKPVQCERLGLVQFSGSPSDWKLLFDVKLR